jgi:hypothetical protein
MFIAVIPVQCAHLERLVLFRAQVALTAIDPARDRPIGPRCRRSSSRPASSARAVVQSATSRELQPVASDS